MADKHHVLFVGRAQTFENLKIQLQKIPAVDLHHEESTAVEEMKKSHVDIIIVESTNTHEHTCTLLEDLGVRHPDSILMLLASQKPEPDKLLQYMNFGVRDILTNDENPELFMQKAIGLIKRRAAAGQSETARIGKVCCFFSSKGGVGKTFLAVTAGRWINRTSDARTILVDLDLQFGDMDLYLDANSVQTIADLMEEIKNNSGRFTDFILDSHIHQVTPGLHLLSAPLSPEKSEMVGAEPVVQLIKILKKRYDFVLLDTSAVLNDVTLAVFDKSDRIFLVVDDEIPSVKNAGQTCQLLKKLNYAENKIDVIVTGDTSKYPLDGDMLLKILSRKPYARIPASPAVRESINQGYNLVEKNPSDPAARGILQFAQKLAGETGLQLTEKSAAGKGMADLLSKAKKIFVKG